MHSTHRLRFNQVYFPPHRAYFPIQGTERIIYICVGSLSLAVAVFNIIVLMKVRALKEPPSDILIMLSIYSITRTVLIDATLSSSHFTQSMMISTLDPLQQLSMTFALPLAS